MPHPQRAIGTVLAEIAEVRRHLHEAPPHHGGGRDALELRLAQLEAELVRLRAEVRRAAPANDADDHV